MAISAVLVGRGTSTGTGGWTSSAGATAATGSTFVIAVSYDAGATGATPTDFYGNTYTRVGTTVTTGNGDKVEMWKCENGAGGAGHTATQGFGGFNNFSVGHLIEIKGAAAASFDVTNQGTDASSPFTVTTPTLNQAAELILTLCGANAGVSATNTYSSSNTTIISQEPDGSQFWTSAVSALVVASTSAVTPSFTAVQGTAAGLVVGTFKEAAGAPAPGVGLIVVAGPGVSPNRRQQFTRAPRSSSVADVTVALTGQSATFSTGILTGNAGSWNELMPAGPGVGPFSPNQFLTSPRSAFVATSANVSAALSGQAATFTAGTVAPSTTVALAGQASAFAAGTLTPNTAVALLGQAATFAAGTLAPAIARALTGQAGTFAAGTLTPAISVSLNGQAASFSAGTLLATPTAVLTGQAATLSAGTLVPNITVGLTGQQAVFSGGTVTTGSDVTVSLTGQAASFTAGVLAPSSSIALLGGAGSFASGNLLPGVTKALTGTAFTSAAGTVGVATDTALQGLSASFTAGILGVVGDVTVALSGAGATFAAGTISAPSTAQPGPVDSPRISEGAYRRKKRKARIAQQLQVIERAPPSAVIAQAATFQALAQVTATPPEALLANVEAEITQWLRVEQDADDEQALMMILKALDD